MGAALGAVAAVLVGGVLADRVPQRRILIVVESVMALGVAIVAAIVLSGGIEIWHLFAISLLLGIGDGFFYPAYSALLPSILPEDELLAADGVEGMLRPTPLRRTIEEKIHPIKTLGQDPGGGFVLYGTDALAAYNPSFSRASWSSLCSRAVSRSTHRR